jgi:hypothetical protein
MVLPGTDFVPLNKRESQGARVPGNQVALA